MKRREFIIALGGAAAAWPLTARGQQAKLRTVGFLGAAGPAVASHWLAAFIQRLHELGWIEGRNVAFEVGWAEGRPARRIPPAVHAPVLNFFAQYSLTCLTSVT